MALGWLALLWLLFLARSIYVGASDYVRTVIAGMVGAAVLHVVVVGVILKRNLADGLVTLMLALWTIPITLGVYVAVVVYSS